MAWEWSHSQEAYSSACENLSEKSREWLEVCYAEWIACERENDDMREVALEDGSMEPDFDTNAFSMEHYNDALEEAKEISQEDLADQIWSRAENHATCDNGGFNAWMCPSGCHSVPFDREDNQ